MKNYIAVEVNGNNYLWLHKRSNGRSLLGCWFSETHLPEAISLLDEAGMPYSKKNQKLRITTDKQTIAAKAETVAKIAVLVKQSWEE